MNRTQAAGLWSQAVMARFRCLRNASHKREMTATLLQIAHAQRFQVNNTAYRQLPIRETMYKDTCMCVYIYIHMYMCVYTCIYTWFCKCIHIRARTRVYVYVHIYNQLTCLHIYTYKSVRACCSAAPLPPTTSNLYRQGFYYIRVQDLTQELNNVDKVKGFERGRFAQEKGVPPTVQGGMAQIFEACKELFNDLHEVVREPLAPVYCRKMTARGEQAFKTLRKDVDYEYVAPMDATPGSYSAGLTTFPHTREILSDFTRADPEGSFHGAGMHVPLIVHLTADAKRSGSAQAGLRTQQGNGRPGHGKRKKKEEEGTGEKVYYNRNKCRGPQGKEHKGILMQKRQYFQEWNRWPWWIYHPSERDYWSSRLQELPRRLFFSVPSPIYLCQLGGGMRSPRRGDVSTDR